MLRIKYSRADVDRKSDVINTVNTFVKSGKRVFLIVPEQLSLQREFEMGNMFPGSVSVLSFARLTDEIFRTFGGSAKKSPDDVMIAAAVYKAVKNTYRNLTYYKSVALRPGFVLKLMSVFSEFEINCMKKEDILALLEKEFSPSLQSKYTDLFTIYDEYKNLWQDSYKAPETDLELAAEILENNDFFKDSPVIFDGFYGFTPAQFKVLEQIFQNTDCIFYFTTDMESELFTSLESEIRTLKKKCDKHHIPVSFEKAEGENRIDAKGIAWLERNAFPDTGKTAAGETQKDGVTVYNAKNLSEELSYIACKIKNDVLDGKYRYRDIAILAPDAESIATAAVTVFRKHGIPVFADVKRSLLTKSLTAFVLFAFEIVIDGFDFENIFALLKTGLTGISFDDISMLENYVRMWKIKNKGWISGKWTQSPSGIKNDQQNTDAERLEKLNALRERILEPLIVFSGKVRTAQNGRDMLTAVYYLLEGFSVRDNLEEIAKAFLKEGNPALYDEYTRIYDIFIQMLDGMYEIAGEDKFTLSEFYDLLTVCSSCINVGNRPSRVDEVVFAGIGLVREENVKCVYIPCMNDGVIPAPFSNNSLITEADKRLFQKHDISVSKDFVSRSLREKFELYAAMTAPSHELVISYSSFQITGEVREASDYIRPIIRDFEFPLTTREDLPDDFFLVSVSGASEIASLTGDDNISRAVFEIAGFSPIPCRDESEPLEKAVVESIYSKHLRLSFSGVEEYVNCPFKFFLDRGLRVSKNEAVEFKASDMGTFIHEGLERLLGGDYDILNADETDVKNMVHRISDDYYNNDLKDCKNRSHRFDYLFSRAKYAFENAAVNVVGEIQNSDFLPFDFEIDISEYVPEIDLGDGFTLSLVGSIDRVDMAQTRTDKYVKVIDYKSGKQKFSLEKIYNGLSMQLPIYAGAVRAKYPGVKFCAIYYLKVGVPELDLKDKSGIDNKSYRETVDSFFKRDGLFCFGGENEPKLAKTGSYFEKVSKTSIVTHKQINNVVDFANEKVKKIGAEILSGNIAPAPIWQSDSDNACKYCDYKTICKRENDTRCRRKLLQVPDDFLGGEEE